MLFSFHRVPALALMGAGLLAALLCAGSVQAHVVPNMTLEASFASDGSYSMTINVDPRTFMAADPTTLPPVPGSWYREQTPSQITATHQKAAEYLSRSLGLVFDGQKVLLPECVFQAIDGADNTPFDAETQEVHLLATTRGTVPAGAATFQVDFAKEANTTLILLATPPGSSTARARVVFAGETSPVMRLHPEGAAAPPVRQLASEPVPEGNPVWLMLVGAAGLIAVIVGWRLLAHYRHHHRFHRKPRSM